MATRAIYIDDFSSPHRVIAPPMEVAVNYRYHRDPEKLAPMQNKEPTSGQSCTISLEALRLWPTRVVHVVLALLTPKCIFIGSGDHGVRRNTKLQHGVRGAEKLTLENLDQLGPGNLLHIETPLSPTGEALNLEYYVAKAHQAGAYISIDATFTSPPLQDPLQFGVDIVIHSGTKYIGVHSNMLCGVLVAHQDRKEWTEILYRDRRVMGSIVGSVEGWFYIRSLRPFYFRVIKQSQTTEKVVRWLHEEIEKPSSIVGRMIDKMQHTSLQESDLKGGWLRKQMPGSFGPVISIWMNKEEHVRRLPSRLYIFQHAPSLGGVESPIEWRAMIDEGRDPRLTWVSCGVEDVEDMKMDMLQAFESLLRDFP